MEVKGFYLVSLAKVGSKAYLKPNCMTFSFNLQKNWLLNNNTIILIFRIFPYITSIVTGFLLSVLSDCRCISWTVFSRSTSALNAIPWPILLALRFLQANSTFSRVFNPSSVGHSPACAVIGTPLDAALKLYEKN